MAKLNFKEFSVFTDISRKERQTGDMRESFANLLYINANGIAAHRLAFKIYDSQGYEEYNDSEVSLIIKVAEHFCRPNIIDSLLAAIGVTSKTE